MKKRFEGIYSVYVQTMQDFNPLTKFGAGNRTVMVYDVGYKWIHVLNPYDLTKARVPIGAFREFEPKTVDLGEMRKRLLTTVCRARRLGLSYNRKLVTVLAQEMR